MVSKPRLQIRPEVLRRKRLERVLSRRELAEKAGLQRQRIDQYEAGISLGIRPENARKLAKALRCSVDELIEVVVEETA